MNNEIVLTKKLADAYAQIEELKKLVFVNTVTHMPNRRALDARLETISKYERHGTFQALYFDFDNFRHINKTYGHSAADDCLREVSEAVQGLLRHDAELYHTNGDEFIVIIQTRLEDLVDQLTVARTIAERVRSKIASGTWTERKIKLSSSIGLTTGTFNEDLHNMLDRAEEMMRESKQNGRNQVTPCNLFEQLSALQVRDAIG